MEVEAAQHQKRNHPLSSLIFADLHRISSPLSYVTLKKRRRLIVNQKESAVNHSNEKCPGHDPSLE